MFFINLNMVKTNNTLKRNLWNTLTWTRLQLAWLICSQVGRSSRFWIATQSNSRLLNSPSPFNVLNWMLSADKFLANLKMICIKTIDLTWTCNHSISNTLINKLSLLKNSCSKKLLVQDYGRFFELNTNIYWLSSLN